MRFLVGASLLVFGVGCDSLRGPAIPEERHAHYECIDIAVAASHDARIPTTSLLLDLEMENTCHRAVAVDVSKLDVWVEGSDPPKNVLTFYDPKNEIGPRHMEPRVVAHERIRADGAGDPTAASRLCFDASAALGVAPVGPTCFWLQSQSKAEGEQ